MWTELSVSINLAIKTLRMDGRYLGGHRLLQIAYVSDGTHLYQAWGWGCKIWKYLQEFYTSICCYCMCAESVWLYATIWTVAHQAPLSMGLSRQEYWSELPFPPPGELASPGIQLMSPILADGFLPLSLLGSPLLLLNHFNHVRLCATPSLGFSRQEHWSGLPSPILYQLIIN